MDNTLRSDLPVSRVEAEKALHRKLPASASSVYYLFYSSGMQELDFYLRFQVDPRQADAAIDDLLADNNRMLKRSASAPRTAVPPGNNAAPAVDPLGRFAPLEWWQPQTIVHGYSRGGTSSYDLVIWYDADHATIYVHQTD